MKNRQPATASYSKWRDLSPATTLKIAGTTKRVADALHTKTQIKTQTCTTRGPMVTFWGEAGEGKPGESRPNTQHDIVFVVKLCV